MDKANGKIFASNYRFLVYSCGKDKLNEEITISKVTRMCKRSSSF